jgi:hypothetical protein
MVNFNVYRAVLLSLLTFCGLFFISELSYRTWLYFRNCDTGCHNIKFLVQLDTFSRDTAYEFLAANPTLGYSPADGTFVDGKAGRDDVKITIREGVRVNPNFVLTSEGGAILVVGGSFVFGDTVSDDKTWPAILERRLKRRVVNGGAPGYGAYQSVMRAEQLLKDHAFSLLILSIVGTDISQDRYVNFSRFYRPVVIQEDGRLYQTTVEQSNRIVSDKFLCAHPWVPESLFWSQLAKHLFLKFGYDGHCKATVHPNAASSDEILELAIQRFAALPVNKVILIQYPRNSFELNIDEARTIESVAERQGVQVIDMYNMLKSRSLLEILKDQNKVVADLISTSIAAMVP